MKATYVSVERKNTTTHWEGGCDDVHVELNAAGKYEVRIRVQDMTTFIYGADEVYVRVTLS